MNQVIAWAAFLGAWLLVAGPLYQGAIELREQDVDRDEIEASKNRVTRPGSPSPWWWLLPPAMYVVYRRRSRAYRRAIVAELSPAQQEQFASFINKATGWFTVAAGAALLAADQTWQVVDHHHWPAWLFWLLFIVMLAAAVLNTAVRMFRDEQAAASDARPEAAPAS